MPSRSNESGADRHLTRGWAVRRFTFHLEVIGGRFLHIPGRIQTRAAEDDPFVQARLQEIVVLFEPLILSEIHCELQGRTHGLSNYFPLIEEESYLETYGSVNLDFADKTNWNEFLEAYYEWQLTGIEGDAKCNCSSFPIRK